MIEIKTLPGSNIVEFSIDGKIEAEEFDRILDYLNSEIEQHGSIRLLEHIVSFGAFPPSKIWDDLKFVWEHLKDIERTAVVADKAWLETWTKIAKPFVKMPVQYFPSDEIDAARAWLASEDPEAG